MQMLRAPAEMVKVALTIAAAVAIGFGVPAGWIWIGSQLQGDTGATSLDFSVAVAVMMGIIITYAALLFLGGWLQSVFGGPEANAPRRRQPDPWNRSVSDSPHPHGQQELGGLERVFVWTTILTTAAFFVWFAFFAGSPLPNQ